MPAVGRGTGKSEAGERRVTVRAHTRRVAPAKPPRPAPPVNTQHSRPSATSIARAQEQQYASQGAAVNKEAKRQVRQRQLTSPAKRPSGDAPQTRAKDLQRAQSYVKGEYQRQAAANRAKGIVKSPRIRVKYKPATTVPPDVAEKAKERQSTATHKAEVAGKVAPVLKVLEQTSRPIHAVAGVADAAVTGKNVLHAASRGIQNKDKTTFSDVLKHAGVKNKLVRGVVGTGLDIGLDPTTYVTGGTGAVARKGAEKAAEDVTKKAVKAGLSEEQAARFGERAATQAAKKAPAGSGVTVKVAGKEVPGVRKATAAAGRGGGSVARKVTPERARRAVRSAAADVNPNVTPAGVEKAVSREATQATRAARGKTNAGNRAAVDLATGIRRQIGEKNYAQVVDAIESQSIGKLPEHLRDHAVRLRSEFRHIRRVQRRAGVHVPERKGYVPRQLTHEARVTEGKAERVAGSSGGKRVIKPSSSKARTETRPMSKLREEQPGRYREDLHALAGERLAEGTASAARADLNRTLGGLGRDVKRGKDLELGPGEAVFHIKGSDIRQVTDEKELQRIVRPLRMNKAGTKLKGASKQGGRYVVLPEEIVKRATEGANPAMGLAEKGLVRGYDKATAGFKRVALATPGFHIRNLIGDTSQAYLGGQNAGRLGRNLVKARGVTKELGKQQNAAFKLGKPKPSGKTIKTGKYGHVPYEEVADRLVNAGAARSGYTAGELRELSSSGAKGLKLKRPKAPAGAKRLLLNREDIPRLATAIHALQQGATWEEAAQRVADIHFDYQHLTSFERNIARRIMPFYTWSARNIPFQAKNIVKRPGKYAAYQKVREEAAKTSQPGQVDEDTKNLYRQLEQAGVSLPGGYEKYLSNYEQRNAGIPVSWKGHKFTLSAGLPLQDLNELPGVSGPGEYLNKTASLVTPIVKDPVEFGFNYNFFFRDQIERDTSPLVAAPAPVGRWPEWAKKKFGVVKAVDKRSGKMIWQWPGKADYVAHAVPGLPSTAVKMATPGHDRQGKGMAGKALGVAGIKSTPVDPTTNAVNLAYARQQEIQKRLAALRQQGIGKDNPNAEWRRLSDQLKITTQIAYQGKVKRGDKVLPKQGGPRKVRRGGGVVLGGSGVKLGGGSGVKLGGGGVKLN